MNCLRLGAAVILAVTASGIARAQERYALIVTGASGAPVYAEKHDRWRIRLAEVLEQTYGFDPAHVVALAEAPRRGEQPATREGVRQSLARLQRLMRPGDLLLVALIGHGTLDGSDAKFNLVGPDLDAREWNDLLSPLPGRLVLINSASGSFPFVAALAAPGRVVITATDAAGQQFATVFPEYFVEALANSNADVDKDGRASIWELFMFATARVRRHYEQRGQLPTERALIDDNGDRVGKEAGAPGSDGALASRTFLDAMPAPAEAEDPRLAELPQRRAGLEEQVEELKARRPFLPEDGYAREFERLMIELARVSREIAKRKT